MSHFLRTQSIYNYILYYHEQNDLPPTMREIAEACHLPLATVFRHLDWLEARGYIIRDHTTRSLRPLQPLQTDEEHVYSCLVHLYKVNRSRSSLKRLHQVSHLSAARVKVALHTLIQMGLVQADPSDRHTFYPVDTDP